jgi:hypothetical protein
MNTGTKSNRTGREVFILGWSLRTLLGFIILLNGLGFFVCPSHHSKAKSSDLSAFACRNRRFYVHDTWFQVSACPCWLLLLLLGRCCRRCHYQTRRIDSTIILHHVWEIASDCSWPRASRSWCRAKTRRRC